MEKHIEMRGKIKSREDYIEFMKVFISTAPAASLRDYFDALTAWTEDMDGYYSHSGNKQRHLCKERL